MRLAVVWFVVACRPAPCPPTTVIYQTAPAPTAPQPLAQPPDPIASDPLPDLPPYPTSSPTPQVNGTQVAIAARLHEEGDKEYVAKRYDNASAKFREAVARVPEAKYFYALCRSLFQEGKFSEALTSCHAVQTNNPPDELRRKTDQVMAKIRAEAAAQGINVDRR